MIRKIRVQWRLLTGLTLLIIAIFPVVYFFDHFSATEFFNSTMSNWFATMLGVVSGIPIALQINRWQQDSQERSEMEAHRQEAIARKIRILDLLRMELELNERILLEVISKQTIKPRVHALAGLKNDLWSAFSNSGELQWIDDLILLDYIAQAYYFIRAIMPLEQIYYDPMFMSAVDSDESATVTYAGEHTVKTVLRLRPDALSAVQEALFKIRIHIVI